MEGINIAVIGANGVGKSHFVQRALGLSRLPGAQPSTMRINVDGTPYAVTLFELDLEYFDVDPGKQIQWPKQAGGSMMPMVHGVLLLYDVMNRDSIIELPQTLGEHHVLPKHNHTSWRMLTVLCQPHSSTRLCRQYSLPRNATTLKVYDKLTRKEWPRLASPVLIA
jgi:GTPase SAR1 family protein